nr:hypothetical protein [uncultured Undibacterium sp.]
MRRVNINFAPMSFLRFVSEMNALMWFSIIALIVCASIAISNLIDLDKNIQNTQVEVHKLQTHRQLEAKQRSAKISPSVTDAQAQAINAAIFQLNLPWNELFDTFETVTPSSIALLAIEPDAKKNLVKVTAEVKTSDDMIAYIRLLKQQKFFLDVVLLKHEIMDRDMNKPLRFQFLAQWEKIEK